MKRLFTLCVPLLLAGTVFAQKTILRGQVRDRSNTPLIGANVVLRDTYDGATTDNDGKFQFETEETGAQTLQVIYIGFDSLTQAVELKGGELNFNLVMREGFNELKVVVITAGAFEASDERKVTVLKPLDIVTTASAGGDTYGALKTLPGAQVSTGDQEGLFVRGGSGTEAPTFIDGMLVRSPFTTSTPDYAARGRFNPFLFKGTIFSTGGYSAQYGQGMSSALVLETMDLPDRSSGALGVSSVGLSYTQMKYWKEKGRSLGINANYTNLAPYFLLVKNHPKIITTPQFTGLEGFFREKTGGNGMLKGYAYFNTGKSGFETYSADSTIFAFDAHNTNLYTNVNWSGILADSWKLYAGVSYSRDANDIQTSYLTGFLYPDTFLVKNSLLQTRWVATRYFGRLTTLRMGAEYQHSTDGKDSNLYGESGITDHYLAAFAESDIYVTTRLVARLGLRGERSALVDDARLAPRVSLAYKFNDDGQVSFAWGHFYQKGDSLLDWRNQYGPDLPGFQRAEHYILNYQYIRNDRTLRVEGFYKKYRGLITTVENLDNDGSGYAQGLELFFRDKKSLPGADYWISYSWLDTRRRFQWYPVSAQPTYAADHIATLVAKKYFTKIHTNVGVSYSFATGRPYYNPNRTNADEFLIDRTPVYQNLSLSVSYLTAIGKAFTVVVLGVNNVLNQEQIFGYRYSLDGTRRNAITPFNRQFIFLGAFLSWGTDRRQEVIDNQN